MSDIHLTSVYKLCLLMSFYFVVILENDQLNLLHRYSAFWETCLLMVAITPVTTLNVYVTS